MNKILYPVTLLIIAGTLLSFRADEDKETFKNSLSNTLTPKVHQGLDLSEATFTELFAIRSNQKNLSFEVYSSKGQIIPGNIYRYHKDGEITSEIGRGIKKGLYIITMSSQETDQYVKWIRFGY